MSCDNCERLYPGKMIRIKRNKKWGQDYFCEDCERRLIMNDFYGDKIARWDTYFHNICTAVATKSPCLSRQIGAILVRDNSIVSTGFNGPARGYFHCEGQCPRKVAGFKSGEGLLHCPAAHAEGNCIANAARIGASTVGSTLYMNCVIPCKDCMILLVNAGIKSIVIDDVKPYHEMSIDIALRGKITLRKFKL